MPVFAPGVWAGINDSMAINRQSQKDALDAQERKARMQRQQLDLENERATQARDLHARQGFGQGMYGIYGAGGPPPVGATPPQPGQSSAPPQPTQGQPAGGPPPQGPPQGQPQQAPRPPGMMPASMPPQGGGGAPYKTDATPLSRAQQDVMSLRHELQRPGLIADQKMILEQELRKAQEKVAQLSTQDRPYQAVPTSAPPQGQPPQGGADGPPPGMGGPPPMTQQQPQQPSLLKRFVMAAQKNGVPPEDLADQIKLLNPIMQDEMKQELASLRGTQAEQNLYIKQLMAENAFHREGRLEKQGDRRLDQGDKKVEQGEEKIKLAREKAERGAAPTASELDDPEVAKVWLDLYKTTGKQPPFAWGAAGQAERAKWTRLVGKSGSTGGEIAADQAEGKANAGALAANTKRNTGLDVGARETLADMATLDSIIDRVATKGGAKVINRPLNKLRDLGSDPEYGQLELATKQVAMKYERMLSGGILSVAQLHEGAREDAKKIMSGDMTVAEIRAKLPLMKREMENAQKAGKATSKDVKDNLAGKGGDEDAQAIEWAKAHASDPRAKKILQMHGM